jgi:putative heme iron utilization protein
LRSVEVFGELVVQPARPKRNSLTTTQHHHFSILRILNSWDEILSLVGTKDITLDQSKHLPAIFRIDGTLPEHGCCICVPGRGQG